MAGVRNRYRIEGVLATAKIAHSLARAPLFKQLVNYARNLDDDALYQFCVGVGQLVNEATYANESDQRKSAEVTQDSNQTWTPAQAARLLKIGEPAVRLAARNQQIAGSFDGRRWQLDPESVRRYAAAHPHR